MTATDLRRRLGVAALLGLLVLSGCGGGGGGGQGGTDVPSFLLSAEQVGGGEVRDDGAVLYSAGPDKSDLVGGGTDADTVAYTRTRGGHEEVVQLSAPETSQTLFDQGRREVEGCLRRRACPSLPIKFTAREVTGLPGGGFGFSSAYASGGKTTKSFLRSYTLVPGGTGVEDRRVMVSLLRTDGSNPSPADLRSLTEAQVAKVEKKMGGGSS